MLFQINMITPLRQPCPPRGGRGACDARYYLNDDLPRFCVQVIRDHRNRGDATAAGEKPPGASESFEDFNRANFSFSFGIMMP